MGPFNLLQLLPMISPWLLSFLRAPADALGWAHLYFRDALLMPEGEPFNRQQVALFCPFSWLI